MRLHSTHRRSRQLRRQDLDPRKHGPRPFYLPLARDLGIRRIPAIAGGIGVPSGKTRRRERVILYDDRGTLP